MAAEVISYYKLHHQKFQRFQHRGSNRGRGGRSRGRGRFGTHGHPGVETRVCYQCEDKDISNATVLLLSQSLRIAWRSQRCAF